MAKTAVQKAPKKAAPAVTQRRIPLDKIDRDPEQPRKLFDADALNLLAESIKLVGVLQPISVRQKADGRFMLVMGERRWRASQLAKVRDIPAVIHREMSDTDALARGVGENLGRVDMTPMEEANSFRNLANAGWSIEEIATVAARKPDYVTWRMDLLRLPDTAQDAVHKGQMAVGLAWEISELSKDAQHRVLGLWGRGEFANTRDAVAFVKATAKQQKAQAAQRKDSADGTADGSDGQGALVLVDQPANPALMAQRRGIVVGRIQRLDSAGAILQELANTPPEELAKILAGADGGPAKYRDSVKHLKNMASKAESALRQAAAIAAATATAQVAPDAVADDAPAEPKAQPETEQPAAEPAAEPVGTEPETGAEG